MQGKQRQEPDEEPAVTFEFEEAGQPERRSRLGAAGTAAVGGAGLIASGGAPQNPDSLDVFDQLLDAGDLDTPDAIPTTSFEDLIDAAADPEFPPLAFDAPVGAGAEALHGAVGAVGGGFRLDDSSAQEAFGASPDVAVAGDALLDALDVVGDGPLDVPDEDADTSDDDEAPDDIG